ncbi:MAG: hypothetical protein LBD29_06255 [Treponema sp.]|nr:hypothetical protein [Treponema sp.]
MTVKFKYVFLILLLAAGFTAHPQSTSVAGQSGVSAKTDMPELPLWLKDLRRAEIVAFGSFPFTMLFASLIVDSYRFFSNNMDSRYAPLFHTVDMNRQEQIITITSAVTGALLISLADFIIVQYKRHKQNQLSNNLPEGTPIIIRKPLSEEKAADNPDSGAP